MGEAGLRIVVDESIILRIADGDRVALSDLYTNTQNAVYCFALSVLRDTETAQDVMQETYIQVLRSARNYIPAQKDPLPWILGITKHLAYAELRKTQGITALNDYSSNCSDDRDVFIDCENKILTQALLSKLKADDRQIVVLHIIAGLKHREIASLLDLPLSTVLNKYSRALKKLALLAGDMI